MDTRFCDGYTGGVYRVAPLPKMNVLFSNSSFITNSLILLANLKTEDKGIKIEKRCTSRHQKEYILQF